MARLFAVYPGRQGKSRSRRRALRSSATGLATIPMPAATAGVLPLRSPSKQEFQANASPLQGCRRSCRGSRPTAPDPTQNSREPPGRLAHLILTWPGALTACLLPGLAPGQVSIAEARPFILPAPARVAPHRPAPRVSALARVWRRARVTPIAGWCWPACAAGVVGLAGLECDGDALVADGEQAGDPQRDRGQSLL